MLESSVHSVTMNMSYQWYTILFQDITETSFDVSESFFSSHRHIRRKEYQFLPRPFTEASTWSNHQLCFFTTVNEVIPGLKKEKLLLSSSASFLKFNVRVSFTHRHTNICYDVMWKVWDQGTQTCSRNLYCYDSSLASKYFISRESGCKVSNINSFNIRVDCFSVDLSLPF